MFASELDVPLNIALSLVPKYYEVYISIGLPRDGVACSSSSSDISAISSLISSFTS